MTQHSGKNLDYISSYIKEKCIFCNAAQEDVKHLFMSCRAVDIIWNSVLLLAGLQQVAPKGMSNGGSCPTRIG
jgi:hypothetical protein